MRVGSFHFRKPQGVRASVQTPRARRVLSAPSARSFPFVILHETPHWLAINKLAGYLSVPNVSLDERDSVSHHIALRYPEMREQFPVPYEFGAVHRLDRPTSGILLIAKDRDTLGKFKHLFDRERARLLKKYWLVVHGVPEKKSGRIEKSIWYPPKESPDGHFVVSREVAKERGYGGEARREALTTYDVLEIFESQGQQFSLVEARLHTGRTHQLRFHFNEIGHPIVGETHYTGHAFKFLPPAFQFNFRERLALHARELIFPDPQTDKPVHLVCEPPGCFRRALQTCRPKLSVLDLAPDAHSFQYVGRSIGLDPCQYFSHSDLASSHCPFESTVTYPVGDHELGVYLQKDYSKKRMPFNVSLILGRPQASRAADLMGLDAKNGVVVRAFRGRESGLQWPEVQARVTALPPFIARETFLAVLAALQS